jgi:uncharacterized protein YdeI (YjbR/CyaY-like superfamily)
MANRDKRIDAYIAKAQPFARPVLRHIRSLVHTACPGVEETMKWSFPHFDYRGQMMCSMAAFKEHCVFGFWKSTLLMDPGGYLKPRSAQGGTAMGNLGRITAMGDLLPDKVFIGFVRQAMKLNDEGAKLPAKPKTKPAKLVIPNYFMKAVRRNKKAAAVFDAFSYSNKKEYVQWVTDAKTDSTREQRLATAVEWMAEGKVRNWKYLRK